MRNARACRRPQEETTAGAEKTDIAITPLAVPMLAGPGAISTAIVLQSQAVGVAQSVVLCVCIVGVALASYVIFRISARGAQWLSSIATKVLTRIMGLLLAAVAIQFMINGLKGVWVNWQQP
ncbi:MAG: MarC family protein [Verrucomicrobiota bacterium]